MAFPSFPQWLAERSDAQLATLFALRPALTHPLPTSFRSLSARLKLRESLVPALTQFSASTLAIVEVAARLTAEFKPCNTPELVEGVSQLAAAHGVRPPTGEDIDSGIATLVEAAVLYGDKTTGYLLLPDAARIIPGDFFSRGPHLSQLPLTDPLAEPINDTHRAIDSATLSRHIAATADNGFTVSRLTSTLLALIGTTPLPMLKKGGLPQRHATQLAHELGCDHTTLARLVSTATATGLISTGIPVPVPDDDTGGNYVAPTTLADDFADMDTAEQWVSLAESWLTSTDAPWRSTHLLESDSHSRRLPQLRRLLLETLAPDVLLTAENVESSLLYHRPLLLYRLEAEAIPELLAEATWLGLAVNVDGGYAATPLLTALLNGDDTLTEARDLIPAPTDRLIAQTDQTLLAPGPLDSDTAAVVTAIADVESPGLASMYRITEASLRRGLDAGYSADTLHSFLNSHIDGEVPASLTYLIDDVARRHGTLRVGTATSYLRSEDPALLAEAVRTVDSLHLIAPTVAVSSLPITTLLTQLRAAGLAPVAEGSDGTVLTVSAPRFHIGARRLTSAQRAARPRPRPLTEKEVDHAIAVLRATAPTAQPDDVVARLHAAVRAKTVVGVRYVDTLGHTAELRLQPLTISGGDLDGLDPATGTVRRIRLAAITAIVGD